ncbi:MAG: hypothetical protein LQ338_008337 [Usnochroma carphineum]|nr:MAG: hypothetical protein LQ338_008337 [Usnochroma carphineum]
MVQLEPGDLYKYTPALVPAIIAIIVFTILTVLHTYRIIKAKLLFCLPFIFGGLLETIGYVGRAIGHDNPVSLPAYILQSIFVLVAPALFAASIYMTLGRVIRATRAESLSPVRVNWLTKLFVLGDVITFFIQGGGGGLMASSDQNRFKTGQYTILGGLFLQILIFSLFIVVSIIFHKKLRKQLTRHLVAEDLKWQKMMVVLYVVSALILVRNIFRVVEYIGGRDGPLLRVEWPIYVFDALLMAATMVIWGVWYPNLVRPKGDQIIDAEEGVPLPDMDEVPRGYHTGAVAGAYSK